MVKLAFLLEVRMGSVIRGNAVDMPVAQGFDQGFAVFFRA